MAGGRLRHRMGLPFESGNTSQQRGKRRHDWTMESDNASARACVSRYTSRRCSRWLRACTSHARRTSAAIGEPRGRQTDSRPRTTAVLGEDRTELQRKGVEQSDRTRVRRRSSGVARPRRMPPGERAPRRRAGLLRVIELRPPASASVPRRVRGAAGLRVLRRTQHRPRINDWAVAGAEESRAARGRGATRDAS